MEATRVGSLSAASVAPMALLGVLSADPDDHSNAHGRPTNVVFGSDGRLFLGNNTNGDIIWIAPLDRPFQ